MYFEILPAKDGGYFVRIRGGNNETVFWSETYRAKSSAVNAIEMVKTYAYNAPVYDRT